MTWGCRFGQSLHGMECPVVACKGLILRPLDLRDAEEWLAGEDDEQLRWFDSPRSSTLADVNDHSTLGNPGA
jgi:hypothetical protein